MTRSAASSVKQGTFWRRALATSAFGGAVALCGLGLGFGFGAIAGVPAALGQDASIDVRKILVDDSVCGDAPDLSTGSFSVALNATILAPGNEPGNGDKLGMLFNVATGWYDGFRAYYDWNSGRITFQIGRENGAVGASTDGAVAPGVSRDVVCVYDGAAKRLFLYVDGVLRGSTEYAGPILTNGEPLNVGFGGAGIGSNKMFVGKLDYWRRALTAEEVAARQANRPAEDLKTLAALDAVAGVSGIAAPLDVAPEAFETALAIDLPESVKAPIRDGWLAALVARGDWAKAEPLLKDAARALLDDSAAAPANESQTARIDRVGNVVAALEKLADAKKSADAARDAAALREKFPEVAETFDAVRDLQKSAERVRKIDENACAAFAETKKDLNAKIGVKISVAPNGSDAADGSESAPVATVARAFELAASVERPAGSVVLIELADGTYRVDKSASANGLRDVVVRPAKGASPILNAATELDNFRSLADAAKSSETVADAASRLPKSVRDKVFVADLTAAGVADVGKLATRGYGFADIVAPIPSLYVDGESQTLARYPNDGAPQLEYGGLLDAPNDVDAAKTTTTPLTTDRPNGWKLTGNPDVDDIWAFGLYQWEWAANFRRVEKIDRDAKAITFDYKDGSGRFHYYFVNVLEELDAPGEYYVDRASKTLYLYPAQDVANAAALNALRVEFDGCDEPFFRFDGCARIWLDGLTLRGGRTTALNVKNSTSVYFAGGTIEQFGGNAVLINDGKRCGVFDSRLREIGACGVRIAGGNRETLEPCEHALRDCFISDFGRVDRAYAPALHAEGCGVSVAHNLMCDSPHHAMRTDGNDMYVGYNEIHSVVYDFSDQSGIDIYCDPSYRGIVIENNLWRHIGSTFALCGQAGIRLDDSISGVVMTGNVFYRSSGGMFGGIQIHGGKDNLCRDNLFVDCKQAFSFSPWGDGRFEKFVKEQFPQHITNEKYLATYPRFGKIFDGINRNYLFDNDVVDCGTFARNGAPHEVFVGNVVRSVPEPANVGEFSTDANALRAWLEAISGRSLNEIGPQGKWRGENLPVTPKYFVE